MENTMDCFQIGINICLIETIKRQCTPAWNHLHYIAKESFKLTLTLFNKNSAVFILVNSCVVGSDYFDTEPLSRFQSAMK